MTVERLYEAVKTRTVHPVQTLFPTSDKIIFWRAYSTVSTHCYLKNDLAHHQYLIQLLCSDSVVCPLHWWCTVPLINSVTAVTISHSSQTVNLCFLQESALLMFWKRASVRKPRLMKIRQMARMDFPFLLRPFPLLLLRVISHLCW